MRDDILVTANNNDVTSVKQSEVISLIQRNLIQVRDDMKDSPYIKEALKVLPVGGYRSAIGAFWNAVVDDLRNKVMFRSIALFNKEINVGREVKTYDDFQNYVNDDQLIEGAYKIGVIGWEAHKVLRHCKETRHIFSGHPKSSDPSIIKVLGLIEDCVKYVLNEDYPMQIIDIEEYITIMGTDTYDRNASAIENALGDLPENYKIELTNRLFTAYVHRDCSTVLRSNIEFCAPILWKVLPKAVKIQIVRRVDQEIPKGDASRTFAAFAFVETVGGMQYLSETARMYRLEPFVTELSESLDDFSIEDKNVAELERFAAYIPSGLLEKYVNSLTQTYIGHIGSSPYFSRTDFFADGAATRIPGMFEKFDDRAADAFVKAIKLSTIIKLRIRQPAKMRRLRALGNIVAERISENYHDKRFFDILTDETKESEFFAAL